MDTICFFRISTAIPASEKSRIEENHSVSPFLCSHCTDNNAAVIMLQFAVSACPRIFFFAGPSCNKCVEVQVNHSSADDKKTFRLVLCGS